MAIDKDFSESKAARPDKVCKLCKEPIPRLALAFSNRVAIENDYCCWVCMLSAMGKDKAYPFLEKKAKDNQALRGKP